MKIEAKPPNKQVYYIKDLKAGETFWHGNTLYMKVYPVVSVDTKEDDEYCNALTLATGRFYYLEENMIIIPANIKIVDEGHPE